MIRFFLDTDDDFDTSVALDITEEIVSWRSARRVHRVSRAESEGELELVLRHGRAAAGWWRVGRLIEGRVGAFVFFRGFLRRAVGEGYGRTRVRAVSWLQFMGWRGGTPDVVGLSTIDALRAVVAQAASGLPGARRPSAAQVEHFHDDVVGRRLYWRGGDRPIFWRNTDSPVYWRYGPDVVYAYGYVGDTDTVSEELLVGPPSAAVAGAGVAIVDRLTAVEYAIENFEWGQFIDEISVLASIERGWVFSGGGADIAALGRELSAAPMTVLRVDRDSFGRYEYAWHVGDQALAQVVGRVPDVQLVDGVIYRQDDVFVPAGVSSWQVPMRDRGRPAEVVGSLEVVLSAGDGLSAIASALAGDMLLEVFNNTGADARADWIEVSGRLRVYQGGDYGERVTGRYGGASVELRGVSGGQAGLIEALDYWGVVGAEGGPEVRSVTLDGRRFAGAWGAELGTLIETDALEAEGISGMGRYWIVGVAGTGSPAAVSVEYELMRFVEGGA